MSAKKKPESKQPEKPKVNAPVPIKVIGWYGICFALTFFIWGVVQIILSILDRTYADFAQNLIIIAYGIPILWAAVAFKSMQKWGWYGLCLIFGLVIIFAALAKIDVYDIILGVMTILAMVGLFLPNVRKHYFAA